MCQKYHELKSQISNIMSAGLQLFQDYLGSTLKYSSMEKSRTKCCLGLVS